MLCLLIDYFLSMYLFFKKLCTKSIEPKEKEDEEDEKEENNNEKERRDS